MSTSELHFSGSEISVCGKTWKLAHRIAQAKIIGHRVVVLYDYMEGPKFRQFQNLEAYSLDGVRLWIAEHPTNETADAFLQIRVESASEFRASNFVGFDCTLDVATGKLLRADLTR